MPVTQKAVAARLGVHYTTVSLALRGSKSIPEHTRQRVMAVAKEMGYQPNASARNLRYQTSNLIGIVVNPTLGDMMFRRITLATQAAHDHGYEAMLFSPSFDERSYCTVVQSLCSHRAQGLIVATNGWSAFPDIVAMCEEQNWPTTYFVQPGDPSQSNLIDTDRRAGYRDAVDHLVKLGHRHIAILTGDVRQDNNARLSARLNGYRDGLRSANLPANPSLELACEVENEANVAAAVQRMLQLKPRPTALLASSDLDACWAIRHLLAAGVDVPKDISVIGFDNGLVADGSIIPLTTLAQPVKQIAELAVEQLQLMIKAGKARTFKPVLCAPELIIRKTTAAPPQG